LIFDLFDPHCLGKVIKIFASYFEVKEDLPEEEEEIYPRPSK
jgi:hypothetical protein